MIFIMLYIQQRIIIRLAEDLKTAYLLPDTRHKYLPNGLVLT